MASIGYLCTAAVVAKQTGECLELIEFISFNDDNIDYGEMTTIDDGTEEGILVFTDRGVESVEELLANVRSSEGGMEAFLKGEGCDSETMAIILAHEKTV